MSKKPIMRERQGALKFTQLANPKRRSIARSKDDHTLSSLETVESAELSSPTRKTPKGRKKLKLSFFDRRKLTKHPTKAYLITMRYGNGTRRTFAIKADGLQTTFMYDKGIYQIVPEEAWFDLSLNQFHLDYMEGFPTPLNREIVVDDRDGNEGYMNVTPKSLRDLVKARLVHELVQPDTVIPTWVWWTLGIGLIVALFLASRGGG